mmetsp:Transcript_31088/g.72303  ORF Transcript_31088/g.72303 Transcript_31088/m.72303 type:complete len:153 (-) Transcript_31088:1788-2246(-)
MYRLLVHFAQGIPSVLLLDRRPVLTTPICGISVGGGVRALQDRESHLLKLLTPCVVLLLLRALILIQPRERCGDGLAERGLVLLGERVLHLLLLHGAAQAVHVALEGVARLHLIGVGLVLVAVLLLLAHHLLDLVLREPTLLRLDRDLLRLP